MGATQLPRFLPMPEGRGFLGGCSMTDARAAAGYAQILLQPAGPHAHAAAAATHVVVRTITESYVQAAAGWLEVLTQQPTSGRPPLRTAGSSRPVQMLWPDLTWRNVLPSG